MNPQKNAKFGDFSLNSKEIKILSIIINLAVISTSIYLIAFLQLSDIMFTVTIVLHGTCVYKSPGEINLPHLVKLYAIEKGFMRFIT